MKPIFLVAFLLLSAVGVPAAPREAYVDLGQPVTNDNLVIILLARATQTHSESRLRASWAFGGMQILDTGTLLYDRKAHTLSYYINFVNFDTRDLKSYVFTRVNDAMLRRASMAMGNNVVSGHYPDKFLDILKRFGARKHKRFDIKTREN